MKSGYRWYMSDAHTAQAKKCAKWGKLLQATNPKAKKSKVRLRKKLYKYYNRAKYGRDIK